MPQIGKRYQCATCETTVMCLRPGAGEFTCCGEVMGEMQMEQLPSGD